MINLSKFAGIILGAAVLFTSCKGKDGDPGPAGTNGTQGPAGPAGPSGQNLTGAIVGFVNTVDEYGVPTNRSGVTVALEGSTPAVTATTNADGRYELAGVRSGTYNLTFSRAGLGNLRRLGVAHVGGDQPTFLGISTISATSTTSIGTISMASPSNTGIQINIPFTNTGSPAGVLPRFLAFASANPNPTAANGTNVFISSISTTGSSPSSLVAGISKANLNTAGFASGTTVYLVVYGSPSFQTGYTDPLTGRFVYSGLTASSNQVSFIVP